MSTTAIRFRVLVAFMSIPIAILFLAPHGAQASGERGDRGAGYARYHEHHNHCGVYASAYRHRRPRYYSLDVKPGRYHWKRVKIRVGTLRRRDRHEPRYRWVRKRVLTRPVRYRLRKHRAHGRWSARPVVIEGQARWPHRSRC
ncbi:MAG: hypothetical protein AAGJ70_05780 [Pseudomonadota bacterium]